MSIELASLLPLSLQGGPDFAKLLYLIPILIWCGAAMWVLWDSVQRAGEWGWVWGVLAFGAAPLIVPLYLVAIVIADRPAPAWVQREKELATAEVKRFKAMGELERVKYLEAATQGGGTMFTTGGLAPHERGVKQFNDAHAEHLIGSQQHAAAFLYLYDLYMLALDDKDLRAEETYRHYLGQLPDGLNLLKRAREKGLSPAQLKVGGIKLLEAWSQPPDRSRNPAAATETTAAIVESAQDLGITPLEQLLRETEPAAPANPADKPLGIKAARDPRVSKRPEVPF